MPYKQPNILFIMSDDHAAHAMSCYGSRINRTPNLDRIAEGGIRFNNCFCTNSICTPSRAAILTGTYNHVNGVTTLATPMDNRLTTFPKLLQADGYQTAVFGKWHLGLGPRHCPSGFDDWAVLPGQGLYHNPEMIFKGPDGGTRRTINGYVTDVITDLSLEWLHAIRRDRPFCLLYHHKASHREWEPDEKHARLYLNEDIPEPDTLYDDYANRAAAAKAAKMRVGVHMNERDLKCSINRSLSENEMRKWAYQRYIKDYLRVVASIDDNVGRVLDWLDETRLAENTLVVYAHYGIRTDRYKLIYYYADALGQAGAFDERHDAEWELFDLASEPHEMHNRAHDSAYRDVFNRLKAEMHVLQTDLGDERYHLDTD